MGFMTNQQDDTQMADPEFQQKMAEGIANGIASYIREWAYEETYEEWDLFLVSKFLKF